MVNELLENLIGPEVKKFRLQDCFGVFFFYLKIEFLSL